MSLKSLANHYITKSKEIDRLKEEQKILEKKLNLMSEDLKSIRCQISGVISKDTEAPKSFLIVYDSKPIVFQVNTSQHPDWHEFISFGEVTPL
jgi:hypothetical protein